MNMKVRMKASSAPPTAAATAAPAIVPAEIFPDFELPDFEPPDCPESGICVGEAEVEAAVLVT
jgi:hypothetical protein